MAGRMEWIELRHFILIDVIANHKSSKVVNICEFK